MICISIVYLKIGYCRDIFRHMINNKFVFMLPNSQINLPLLNKVGALNINKILRVWLQGIKVLIY